MAARRRSSVSTRAQSVDLENLYPHNHLFVLKPDNPFRKACVSICTSKTFESFIMLVIAGNCVMMAMNTPLPNDDKSNLNIKLEALDVYLLAIFMVEAFLKIVSQGFILHRHSYMRTPWNILDFVVIVTGILPYAGLQGGPTKVIKAAKVLRPLKLVSGVPSLQLVMSAILKSMGSLMEISLLIGFVIVIYAIIGISLLMGMLRQTCVYTSNNTIAIDQFLCGTSDTGGRPCPDGTECLKFWSGPSSGITSFDNILLGCITVFQCMTGEGWTDIMYAVFKVFDYKARFTWIYFYSLNVIGAQFMLNLVCGVLSGEFSKENERVANRDEFLRQRAELAAERAIEKYEGWVDEGELAAAKELEESLKIQEQIEDQGEVIVPPHYRQFFFGIFLLEMCLKFYALGPIEYFQSKFNFFDCVVVFASIINWLLSRFLSINLGVSVLRQLRLMRLFKFTSHWSSLKALIASILASMTSIMSLVVLLLLFLMIFGLLGMQLFGGQLYVTNPRSNFDDFFNAVLTVFQIVTGEDWNNTMYEGINAMGGALNAVGLAVSLYYILCTSLGNFVLLNVFLAIAVDNISLTADEKEQVEEENGAREEHLKEIHEKYSSSINEEEEVEQIDELNEENIVGEFDSYPSNGTVAKPGDNFLENLKNPARMLPQPFKPKILDQRTLFFLEPTNIIRRIVHEIISYAYFDNIILALILISSALLACEDVTDPDALVNVILGYSDYGFTAIFTLEALLKIINFGGFLHPGSFFRDAWNCVDMFVVTCSIMSIILSMNKKTASKTIKLIIKVLRILRVLRPLKVINKLPKLKAVFVCMIFSLKNVVMVLIITAQLLLIFSIMGVQLFSGLYWYCTDESKDNQNDCVGYYITFQSNNYNQPIEKTRDWVLYTFNFEDTVSAFITLFTSSTGDGWYIHMQHGIDSTEEHNGPIRNNKIWVSIYFLMFVVIFSFFFINVFVGMIILTFQELAAAESGLELDRNTKNSLIFAMTAKPMERFMPEDIKSLKYTAWSLIESQPWEMLITSLIIMNIITMIIEYEGEPLSFNNFMASVSTIFSFVFVFEFAIKFFALGFNYFKDFWNVFDMFIVFGGLLDFCIKTFFPQSNFPTSIFRLFRALRLVKLLRRSRSLRILLWTFLKSFQVFSQISIDPKDDPWGQINEDNNFRSYFSSTQVLFRIATGENWPNIMKACTTGAMCDLNMKSYDGSSEQCGTPLAYIYFISFIFFCTFLMLNLFIAVIMDNFSFLTEDSSILGPHHLDEVVTVWSDFDPRATGRIKHTEVCELLRQMAPPVGLGRKCPKILAYKRLVKMNMTLYKDGSVDFTGLFFALVRTGLQVYTENANLKSNELAFRKMLKREFPNISKRTTDLIIPRTPKDSTHMTIGKVYSAKLIWENYKNMRNNNLRRKSIYCTEAISDT